ncbi:hypothetical protein FM104_09790 [Microbacterium esteraromaticum]|uniref:Uncharacterized protein n=1 Tax=Microbacterium esteraromaticum TaxID=57043 RepID=A0A1R4K0I5_9MICO|nr:hypothetical protein FM104_09790 [Microbacterium esteraromaticum]
MGDQGVSATVEPPHPSHADQSYTDGTRRRLHTHACLLWPGGDLCVATNFGPVQVTIQVWRSLSNPQRVRGSLFAHNRRIVR